jgi:hypothetical protein
VSSTRKRRTESRVPSLAAAGAWVLYVAVGGSVVAMGSLDVRTLAVVAVGVAAATLMLWWRAEPVALRSSALMIVVAAVVTTLWTALQAIPLPIEWLRALAPHTADVWTRARGLVGAPLSSPAPISLDPHATHVEILRGTTYLSALLAALKVAERSRGVRAVERAIVVAAAFVVIATVVHATLGLRKVYGIYEPLSPIAYAHVAPLLNPNHLSGYLNLGLCVAFASALSPAPCAPRPLLGAVCLLIVPVVVWLGSRAGVATMVLGLLLVAGLTVRGRRMTASAAATQLVVVVALLGGVGLLVLGTFAEARAGLADTDVTKLETFRQVAARMVPAYPWFGAGRGAFESTFPEFRSGQDYVVFTHAENVLLQWASEWGLPVALFSAGAIAWALRPKTMLARPTPPIGPWVALAVVGLHNLLDFSIEVPGVMVALVACAAIVTGGVADRRPSRRAAQGVRRLALAVPGFVLAACAVAVPGRAHDLTMERARAQKALDAASDLDLERQLDAAILAHPAEPYFPYVGALAAFRRHRPDEVVGWAGRALERAPVYPPAHLLLARHFRGRSRSQALLHYRIAAEQDPRLAGTVGLEGAALVQSVDDAMSLAPNGARGDQVLLEVAEALVPTFPATVAQIDEIIALRVASAPAPHLRAARAAVMDLEAGDAAPWCASDRRRCEAGAIDLARRAQAVATDRCEPYELEAKVMILAGDRDAAVTLLMKAADRVRDTAGCLRHAAEFAIEAQNDVLAQQAIERLANASCSTESECIELLLAAARLEDARGFGGRALILYKRAMDRAPDRDDLAELVATRAAAAGVKATAIDAYERLARRHPEEPRYRRALDELRASRR